MTYEDKYDIIDRILADKQDLFLEIEYSKFIDALIVSNNVTEYLGMSDYRFRKLTKRVFPEKTKGRLINYILAAKNYKLCRHCDAFLKVEEFRPNKNNTDGLNSYCKPCHNSTTASTQAARQAKYSAAKLQRTPPWADLEKIRKIYRNCPEGYHVDHIIPLQGELISGLHVESNLQYLPAIENCRKGNKFIP